MEVQMINDIIKSQEGIYKEIIRIYTNIKKDSASRKTSIYVTERKSKLTDIYTKAKENHALLIDQHILQEHTYIKSKYFDTITKVYSEAMEYLECCDQQDREKTTEHKSEFMNSVKLNIQLYRVKSLRQGLQKAAISLTENKSNTYYTMLLEKLQKQWRQLEEDHFTILSEEHSDHSYFQDDVLDSLKSEYDDVVDQLYDAMHSENNNHKSSVKLPKIIIPQFTGTYDSWNSFYDLFLKVIHEDKSLTATEKMQYLKTYVKGDASKLIKHLTVCEANYMTAWTLLTNRYNNERLIVTKHIDNILNMPKIVKGTAFNLRKLHDTFNENLEAIKNQNIDISSWDPILTRLLSRTWDTETEEKYEYQLLEPNKPQPFSAMMSFLEKRFKCLENLHNEAGYYKTRYESSHVFNKQTERNFIDKCWLCKNYDHNIYKCGRFLAMSAQQCNDKVREHRICVNCLMHDASFRCYSIRNCKQCGKQGHHSLIHLDLESKLYNSNQFEGEINNKPFKLPNPSTRTMANMSTKEDEIQKTTLLATALVRVNAFDGTSHLFRVLCDHGSQASFCTEEVAQLLSYPRSKVKSEISGIGDEKPKISNHCIEVVIQPRFPTEYKLPVTLIILPKLTGSLPSTTIEPLQENCLMNKLIADPTYYKRGPIDIILGAQEYSKLILDGLHKIQNGIIAQNTEFGWILSGICDSTTNKSLEVLSMTTHTTEMRQLTTFWELEDIPGTYQLSHEDQICEDFYKQTTKRNSDGSYTVRLPFKNRDVEYGNTRQLAVARLLQLERRFMKNETLQSQYQEFLNEYLEMGHMRKVRRIDYCQGKYYIPHQPVIKEDSLTTKLRVVFDASSKLSSNISLNSNLFTGPKLQQDLASILLRWRKHKVVFMADIEKMYRFIKLNKQDWTYQRILWRESPKHPIDEYELTTVTYGTSSAPYLAIRTLQQLAKNEKENYPRASHAALQDFYVDDILSGGSDIESTKILQRELICMLRAGGFNLRKWSSNYAELLESIPNETQENDMLKIPFDETRKSLGILWSPVRDSFSFEITINIRQNPTKRVILSEVAKLFDPLDWLAPVLVNMKLIIQELWTNGTEWDQPVDKTIKRKWLDIQDEMKTLENISIPRWSYFTPDADAELHGFCDSSEKAYGAVVYCRIRNEDSTYNVILLQAKSKVAPKKQKITLPKLELCAARLLAQLMNKVINVMEIPLVSTYCWTDSMITLGWIKGEANRWKTFVANRVSDIQKMLPKTKWNYVHTCQNPADIITRGVTPNKLQHLDLWWNGPAWLKHSSIPSTKTIPEIYNEIKNTYHVTIKPRNVVWERFSSFNKMIRVLCYCYRILRRNKSALLLSCEEISKTTNKILLIIQQEEFAEEYRAIKNELSVKRGSKISSLDPFISSDGLMRVGGRLQNSYLPYNQKHPILLPNNHHVTSILIHDAHLTTLHGGNKLTLAYIRQKYWILGGKQAVKNYIRKCVKCIRYKATPKLQKMGILPAARVTESFPFTHTGVDYAGPIQVRAMKGRGHKSYKGYIAIFICLATKAIHLEFVGDLSTESFIAALRRFTARRGPVSHMYSDNATNFVGAANFLYKELLEITQSEEFQNTITTIGIQWHFIPPSSPHFGGIWEAGVKSMKHHLRRVIGEQTLTYEELSTFLHQTEACLNSRPLCAQSEDIYDTVVLTPSHFLIGREAIGIPDPVIEINTDLLNKWKHIQKMKKDFWKSWTNDYLHQLQQRYKWKTNQENLTIGTLVLMKDENINPSKWPLAKIKEIHAGSDGLTRVVTLIKPSGATQKRSINTLIPLPIGGSNVDCSPTVTTTTLYTHGTINDTKTKKLYQSKQSGNPIKGFMYLLCMIQIFGSVLSTTIYSIKQLSPGFYIEQLGTANIDRGMFRIETVYGRERLNEDHSKILMAISKFYQLCETASTVSTDTHCEQFYQHLVELQLKFERIKEYFAEIPYTRRKRGLLGQFLTSIFGVNDEVYKDIDSLNMNQQKLIEAASHQTKFMISTISQVNSTEERIKRKLEGFQTKLNQVIANINMYDHWYVTTNHNSIKIQIMQTYHLATNYIEEIIYYYSGLLEIYLTKANIYNILSPKNVSDLIVSANKKLPSNLKIMQQQLLETKIVENSSHIQVHAYFPIQDITRYTLIHVTPVPKKNKDNSFQIIEVPKTYIGFDYNHELYFELNHREFKDCIHRRSQFICFPGAVKNMQLNENCIVDQLFKNQTHNRCPAKQFEMPNNIMWKQLCMQNSWLFITKTSVTISIICDGQREEIVLREIGVIKIADNCIIKSINNRLAAKRTLSMQIISSYSKPLNFTIDTFQPTSSNLMNISKEQVIDSSQDIYQHLINKENALHTELSNNIWKEISSHTYLVSSISSIILIIMFIVIICYGPKLITCIRAATHHHNTKVPQRATQFAAAGLSTHICYNRPNQQPKPPRKRAPTSNQEPPTSVSEPIELYDLEPVAERGQNVHA